MKPVRIARSFLPACSVVALAVAFATVATALNAQDRLKTMPGYEQYARMAPQIAGSIKSGAVVTQWADDSKSVDFNRDNTRFHFDVASKKITEMPGAALVAGPNFRFGGGPERGRQFDMAVSPDSTLKAFYRDRNLWVSSKAGQNEVQVTTDGSETKRIKYGTASWVYGEELSQVTAFWWSPDSKKVAYYRFDESGVPDYYLQLDQTKLQSKVDVEAYPKAGVPNPVVDLFVYDVATKQSTRVDVRDGKPFSNDVVGHYVYGVSWSPDGKEITFNRTNRRQNTMEFTACAPDTGKCRVIIHEEWLPSWTENSPGIRFLADKHRFIWESERTGFNNYYLYDMSGKLIAPLTQLNAEVSGIVKIDEGNNALYYMARDGDNYLKTQLHRVQLDGRNDRRMTDPAFAHTVSLSPDGKYFVDIAQTHDQAPTTRVLDMQGKVLSELATSDISKFEQLGLKKVEMFTYLAADGKTTLHGMISFPSTFDPSKKYPVLVPVYGGPASASNTSTERFTLPSALTEYGFLVVNLDSRATPGMGKRTLDAIYLKLGQVEMDDMAAGVQSLWNRPYFDKDHVGIFGTSYGGYSSALSLLRHPEVYAAASASSPVTDWRHYDTIYTERYMWIPQENKDGYDLGSTLTYADKLKGRLMLYYGTADNNVHPSNMMQLIQALQKNGKSFDVQVGPDQGHSGINNQRMMEFFIDNLASQPATVLK